jgi:elongation factor 3
MDQIEAGTAFALTPRTLDDVAAVTPRKDAGAKDDGPKGRVDARGEVIPHTGDATTTASATIAAAVEKMTPVFEGRDVDAITAALRELFQLCVKYHAAVAPFTLQLVSKVFELAAHKKSPAVREAAERAAIAIVAEFPENATHMVLPSILAAADNANWRSKVAVCNAMIALAEKAPVQVASQMPVVVPALTGLMFDAKKQVKEVATEAMKAACAAIDNQDLEPFVPSLISAISTPSEVTECVHALAATTFVATVDAAAMAIVTPVLAAGFKERITATKRKSAVIAENMAKLVANPAHVAPFMPLLLPALARAMDEVADPECRDRCKAAHEVLSVLGERVKDAKPASDPAMFAKAVRTAAVAGAHHPIRDEKKAGTHGDGHPGAIVGEFVCKVAAYMVDNAEYIDTDDWAADLGVVMASLFAGEHAETKGQDAAFSLFDLCTQAAGTTAAVCGDDVVEEGDDVLCDVTFSLAYGSKILLNSASMRLVRGRRYGIVAPKSAGKTTLLRAISNGQVEGFPTADQLKTVFVEHDIQGSQVKMNVVDFTYDSTKADGVTMEDIKTMLTSIGFTAEMQAMPITALSGGWKMKLGLARAMLRKADILLLDEPTNHLDVLNVQWVVDYLTSETCSQVTTLMVSHDTGFLDKTATHIIHFETLKLATYVGNLSAFVERFPEAKSYYDLAASTLEFTFPEPGPLPGVRSKGRAILQLKDVSFTYPGAEKPQLLGVSVRVSMASRVACVGANGAGKSTMIKLLTGEMEPSKGKVIKHPNCRFAYVAQHAFHHIEQHLDKTPTEYLMWRFQGGEDKEALRKSTVKISEEEEKKMKTPFVVEWTDEDDKKHKEKRVVEKILSRRKCGKTMEYEVKFVGKSQDLNMWYLRDKLIDMGFEKLVEDLDRRKAAAEGNMARALTKLNIEKHFLEVGLERELASHNRIRGLSGGQKVKVVLGACTWAQPHLIILDEPTNYLDRESLGALAKAINKFEGGILLITHNKEFADATTRQTWVVANNRCDVQGDAEWEKYAAEAIELKAEEEMLDASGNTVEKKKTPDSVKPREKKKMIKELKKKIKADGEMTDFEQLCATTWGLWEQCV